MIGRPSPVLLGSTRRAFLFVILLLAQSLVFVTPEIIDLGLNMIIDASSDEVHFVRGYLKAPASIDLSGVEWITSEEFVFDFDEGEDYEDIELDDEFGKDDDDEVPESGTSAPTVPDVEIDVNDNEAGNDSSEVQKEEPSDIVPPGNDVDIPMTEQGDDTETIPETPETDTEGDLVPPGNDVDIPVTEQGDDTETIPETPKADTEGDLVPPGNDVDIPVTEQGDDTETTSETPETDTEGDDEEEPAATEDENNTEDIVEEEKENDADVEETTNEDENNNATDEASEQNDVDQEKEPVEEETNDNENEDVAEEPTTTSEGNDEVDNAEDNGDAVDQEEEEPVTPAEDDNGEGGDEVDDNGDAAEEEAPIANGGNRTLGFTDFAVTGSGITNQVMDIIVFAAPSDCKKDRSGTCDWVALGVGAYDNEMVGEMSYCCSRDTADRNICSADDIGTLMIDHTIFDGDHRTIAVPSEPLKDFTMDDPLFKIEKSGDYVMVIANCNDDGAGVIALGQMEWKSVGGYLPGEMFDFMIFMGATSAVYLVLAVWYFCGMRSYQEAAIPIQKFILATTIIGFLAHCFKAADFLVWNMTGLRSDVVMYIGVSFGILFQALLRCLGVMVAMGWGVVRDTLGMTYCKIIILGLLYAGAAFLREMFEAAARATQLVSSNTEEELVDLALVLSLVIFVINVIFYVWILSSLGKTTEYLRNMNQTSKLRRHLRLRCLVITSLVIITVLTVANTLQTVATILPMIAPDVDFKPFLTVDQEWILKAVGYGNHLFILFGVIILWRPNPDAKDYAMQMQIPSNPDDENDLELSCVVPSADDMDTGEGYKIESAIAT